MYANVIVEISHESLDRTFQYRVPSTLEGRIKIGDPVKISLWPGQQNDNGICDGTYQYFGVSRRQNQGA